MLLGFAAFVVLLSFWLLLSGVFTPFLVAAGLGAAAAVVLFSRRMRILDREGFPLAWWRATFSYWPWLLIEIVKSGWTVSRIILDPKCPATPTMIRFIPLQRTAVGLVTHANSITLTPGTITVEADGASFLVHALTRDGARSCIDSEMDRRIRAIEERT